MRDYLAVNAASREGAGAVAAGGRAMTADCDAVQAVVGSLGSAQLDPLDRIEVFRADSSGNQIVTATNVYKFQFGDPGDCRNWQSDVSWSPSVRHDQAGAGPLDGIGVRIVLGHRWASGVPPFAGTVTIDEASVTRLPPRD